jgi:hypothetical protein
MLELNREYPQNGEQAVFDRLAALTRAQMRQDDDGSLMRGQHAKSTGCAEAEFVVGADLPADCRVGVFKQPGAAFRALVRFSNSQGTREADGKGTARGAAIKLLDVAGARAIPDQADRTQDFLLVNHPVFPFSDPADYLAAIERRAIPIIGGLAILSHLILEDREALAVVRAITSRKIASPLETAYWSGSPYWLGSPDGTVGHAVKYSLVPQSAPTEGPSDPSDEPEHYLREALVSHLAERDAAFDFRVQLQTDANRMPIEDATAEWDETVSVPITVATLRIPRQDAAAIAAAERRCDGLSFNPWHALAEHRPMGGLNRLRRAVYEASFSGRKGS